MILFTIILYFVASFACFIAGFVYLYNSMKTQKLVDEAFKKAVATTKGASK